MTDEIDDDLKDTGKGSPFAMISGGGGPINPEKYQRAIDAGMEPPSPSAQAWQRGERVSRYGERVMLGDPKLEPGALYLCRSSSRPRWSAFIPARLRAAFGITPDFTNGGD